MKLIATKVQIIIKSEVSVGNISNDDEEALLYITFPLGKKLTNIPGDKISVF